MSSMTLCCGFGSWMDVGSIEIRNTGRRSKFGRVVAGKKR